MQYSSFFISIGFKIRSGGVFRVGEGLLSHLPRPHNLISEYTPDTSLIETYLTEEFKLFSYKQQEFVVANLSIIISIVVLPL